MSAEFSLFVGVTLFNCLKAVCSSLVENEDNLNDLDRAAGDGDTGTTIARGANGTFIFCFLDDFHVSFYSIDTICKNTAFTKLKQKITCLIVIERKVVKNITKTFLLRILSH